MPVSSEYRNQVPTPDLGSIMSVTNIPKPSHPISQNQSCGKDFDSKESLKNTYKTTPENEYGVIKWSITQGANS